MEINEKQPKPGGEKSLKGKIVTEDGIKEGFVRMKRGIITEIGSGSPDGNDVLDVGNSYIVPGFIDLHMHGIHRYLVDNGPEDLSEICRILPRYGVTGFLPTVAPRPKGEDTTFLKTISKTTIQGAEILGFFLEGPFLTITGSLPSDAISNADVERVNSLIEAAKPYKALLWRLPQS